jgi:hypothetical protein
MIMGLTGLFYALVVIFSSILYAFFASKPGCGINIFFISFNLLIIIGISIVSILPKIQEENPRSGIFQSAILSLYTTYLVGSAIGSQPNDDSFSCRSLAAAGSTDDGLSKFMLFSSISITLLAIGYSAYRTGSTNLFGGNNDDADEDEDGDEITYNYSWFHFIFVIAAMYSTR